MSSALNLSSVPASLDRLKEQPGRKQLLSIVVAAFSEEGNVHPLYHEIRAVMDSIGQEWELVYIDDGSTDSTWERIRELNTADARVSGLRLSRNFGHQYALLAGLSHVTGRAIITMDCDLQHPPSVIPDLLDAWDKGNRIVHTMRLDHLDVSWFKKLSSRAFYRLFSLLSGVTLSPGRADFRLLDRQVLDQLLEFREAGLFLRGLVEWVGYPSTTIEFRANPRHSGSTKFSLFRMLRFAWVGITSFSIIPLRIGILIGLMMSAVAFLFLAEAVYSKVFGQNVVPGWATIVALTGLLFGILFILIGVLGEYLGRVLEQVRQRPRFIVSETTRTSAQTQSQEALAKRRGVAQIGTPL